MFKHVKNGIMSKIKLAVVYYSSTGANYKLAKWAAEGAERAGAEVKLRKIKELAPESAINSNPAWKKHYEATKDVPIVELNDLEWADAIIFSVPTRYGSVPSQVQQFIDTTGGLWFQGKLANKVVSAMATAMNTHGGQIPTILSVYKTMIHWGAIIAAPGYTDQSIFAAGGNPYGTSASVDADGNMKEDVKDAVMYQAKRTVLVSSWVKNGLNNL